MLFLADLLETYPNRYNMVDISVNLFLALQQGLNQFIFRSSRLLNGS